VNTTAIGVLLVASVLSTSAIMINAQSQMQALNNQFNDIMNQTMSFLDKAWNIAQKFQNPNYNYDPSELGNFTLPEPGNYTPPDLGNFTLPEPGNYTPPDLGNFTLPDIGNFTITEIPSATNSGQVPYLQPFFIVSR
jgi:hypothetical protein